MSRSVFISKPSASQHSKRVQESQSSSPQSAQQSSYCEPLSAYESDSGADQLFRICTRPASVAAPQKLD